MPHMQPLNFASVPEDIQERFTHYQETRGFTPNSIQTMARRPDIVQAKYQIKAQTDRIGVAEALRLPAISLRHLHGLNPVEGSPGCPSAG